LALAAAARGAESEELFFGPPSTKLLMPVLLLCPGDARLEVATVSGETFGQLKSRVRGLEPERVGNKFIRLMFRGRVLADTDSLDSVVPAPDEDVIHAFLSEPVAAGVRS
jgi:hypothetical protein